MKFEGRRVVAGERVWVCNLPVGGIPAAELLELASAGVPYEELHKRRKPVPLVWFEATYIGMCSYGPKFKRYMKSRSQGRHLHIFPAVQELDSGQKRFLMGSWCVPDKEVKKGLELPTEFRWDEE
jgi:hypothetical protein